MRGMREAVPDAAEVDGAPQRAHGARARQVHALRRHLPPVLQHGAAQGPAPPAQARQGARLRVPVRARAALARQAALAPGDARRAAARLPLLQRQVRARRLAHPPRAPRAQPVLRRRAPAGQAGQRAVPRLQTGVSEIQPTDAPADPQRPATLRVHHLQQVVHHQVEPQTAPLDAHVSVGQAVQVHAVQGSLHPTVGVHLPHERAQVGAAVHVQLLRLPVHPQVQLPAPRARARVGQEVRVQGGGVRQVVPPLVLPGRAHEGAQRRAPLRLRRLRQDVQQQVQPQQARQDPPRARARRHRGLAAARRPQPRAELSHHHLQHRGSRRAACKYLVQFEFIVIVVNTGPSVYISGRTGVAESFEVRSVAHQTL